MNAYLSKPISFDQMNALLQEKIALLQETPDSALERLIKDTGFDKETATSLLKEGIQSCLETSANAIEALEEKNLAEVKEKLHSLKGVAGNLRMVTIADWAAEGEILAEAENWEELKKILLKVYRTLKEWEIYINRLNESW